MSAADAAKLFAPYLCKHRVMSPRPGEVKDSPEEAIKAFADLLDSPEDLFAVEVPAIDRSIVEIYIDLNKGVIPIPI